MRGAAVDRAQVEALAKPAAATTSDAQNLSESFEETVERRVKFLTNYQNAAYAARYRSQVEKVTAAEAARSQTARNRCA